MRLKITKQLAGSIDGLHLDRFRTGEVYDVGTSLSNYLLAVGAAEPAGEQDPAHPVPIEHHEPEEVSPRLSCGQPGPAAKAGGRKRRPARRRGDIPT